MRPGVEPYNSDERGELLVKSVEELSVAEALQWASAEQKSDQRGDTGGKTTGRS